MRTNSSDKIEMKLNCVCLDKWQRVVSRTREVALKMASGESWKYFGKEVQFWNGKLAENVACRVMIVDFWKLMKSEECFLNNVS